MKKNNNKQDAESSNTGSSISQLEHEGLIDPGNEHCHNEEWNCQEEDSNTKGG